MVRPQPVALAAIHFPAGTAAASNLDFGNVTVNNTNGVYQMRNGSEPVEKDGILTSSWSKTECGSKPARVGVHGLAVWF